MNDSLRHSHYLEELVWRLDEVGEDISRIITVIKEPIWYMNGTSRMRSLCDLIVLYPDDFAVPIEMKSNKKRRHKALHQIRQGDMYIQNVLHYNSEYGLFVWHIKDRYDYEKIKLP
jgi:hypothetical protein